MLWPCLRPKCAQSQEKNCVHLGFLTESFPAMAEAVIVNQIKLILVLPSASNHPASKHQSIKRVLVIKHGAFGDIIQAQGAMRDIRQTFPAAKIAVLSEPGFSKIWQRCPYVDEIITDAREPRWRLDIMWQLRGKLYAFDPDYVVDLQNSNRSAFYRHYLLPKPTWSFIDKAKSAKAQFPKSMPSLERKAGQLRQSDLQYQHVMRPDISWFANDVAKILTDANVQQPYIALIPGCSARHPHKRWTKYGQLAKALLDDGFDVVTVPGPDELDLCAQIPGTTLTGDRFLDWFDLAGVLQQAEFVVGNDTGPTHIAAHLDRPGLALFGPHTTAQSTSIASRRLEAIETDDLNKLTVDTVLKHVRDAVSPRAVQG